MLDLITKKSKFHYWSLLIIPFLIFGGMYWGTNDLPLSFLGLLISGTICLNLEFGWSTFKRLMGKMSKGSWKYIFISIVVSFVLSYGLQWIGSLLSMPTPQANSAVQVLQDGGVTQGLIILIPISVSLAGEELITAAIALPILYLMSRKFSTNTSWVFAMIISSLLFGLMHINAYGWDMWQLLVVIGLGRIPLTWAWQKTNSLWGGIIAHIVFDLIIMVPIILH